MSGFTPTGGSGGLPLQTEFTGATNPTVVSVAMPSSGTEYSYSLPQNTKQFSIKLRGEGRLQLSYIAGQSGTTFTTIPRYCFCSISDLKLSSATSIYFQSDQTSQVAEIEVWV